MNSNERQPQPVGENEARGERDGGWVLTDEEGAGERPPLRTRDDGEGEPVRGDEGVQQGHCGDAPDRGRLLRGPPQPAQPAAVHPSADPRTQSARHRRRRDAVRDEPYSPTPRAPRSRVEICEASESEGGGWRKEG